MAEKRNLIWLYYFGSWLRIYKVFKSDLSGFENLKGLKSIKKRDFCLRRNLNAVSVLTDECDPSNLKPVDISEIIAMAEKAEPDMIVLFRELIKSL